MMSVMLMRASARMDSGEPVKIFGVENQNDLSTGNSLLISLIPRMNRISMCQV